VNRTARDFDLISDNLYTRVLGGRKAYEAPFGGLNSTHVVRSLELLRGQEWLLLLGRATTDAILQTGLGWVGSLPHLRKAASETEQERCGSSSFAPFSTFELAYLEDLNRHDRALLDEAEHLHRLDVISLKRLGQLEKKGRLQSISQSINQQQLGREGRLEAASTVADHSIHQSTHQSIRPSTDRSIVADGDDPSTRASDCCGFACQPGAAAVRTAKNITLDRDDGWWN